MNPANVVRRNPPAAAEPQEAIDRLFEGSSDPDTEEVGDSDAARAGAPSDASASESDDSQEHSSV